MQTDDLLESWRLKVGGWRWLHYHSMHHYKLINGRFTYTSIALSTIAGAGGFTTAGSSDSSNDESVIGKMKFYSGYILGAINVVIGLLNSFQRFGKAAEKTELHAHAALQYAMLYRSIETELSMPIEKRKTDFLQTVLHEMDRLLAQSPQVPQKIIDLYNKEYPNIVYKPDVCNGMGTPVSRYKIPSDTMSSFFNQPNSPMRRDRTKPSFDWSRPLIKDNLIKESEGSEEPSTPV